MAKFIQTMYLLFCYPDEDVKKFFQWSIADTN